jgi:ABC-2 type transport system ATP-binding protein
VIALEAVGKTYRTLITRREVRALDNFSLTVSRGEVVGIAGPNGAGKSTLISLIIGFLTPTSGTVRIDGQSPRAYVERTGVGYLPELPALPPRWTVREALVRRAVLGGRGAAATRRALELSAQLGLDEHLRKQVRQLSKGNLQRLGLGQALLDDSDLLILDEPTHGLDPLWTQRFRELVATLRRPDRLILVASHNLDELERIADRVAIIHQGRLQRVERPGAGDDTAETVRTWRLVLAPGRPLPPGVLSGAEPVEGREGAWRVQGTLADVNAELRRLLEAGGSVAAFGPEVGGLESAFRAAVGEQS